MIAGVAIAARRRRRATGPGAQSLRRTPLEPAAVEAVAPEPPAPEPPAPEPAEPEAMAPEPAEPEAPAPEPAGAEEIGLSRPHRRLRPALVVAVLLVAGSGAIAVPRLFSSKTAPEVTASQAPAARQETFLVITTAASDLSQQADSLAFFAIDRSTSPPPAPSGSPGAAPSASGAFPIGTAVSPVVMFLPTSTLSQIPGQDFDRIGKAYSIGGASLQVTTAENLLGVRVDEWAAFSDRTLAGLVDRAGGIVVDVPDKLLAPSGRGRFEVAFEAGSQRMEGAAAARYFGFTGEGESELSRFPRMRAVWEGLFQRFAQDPPGLAALFERAGRSVASGTSGAEVGGFLASFAAAPADDRSYPVLPVKSVGTGDAYQVEEGPLGGIVEEFFPGSSLRPAGGATVRVEIRNGNGRPDSGARVASRLVRAGMKVVVTGNAPSFNYPATKIVVYSDDRDALAVGDRVRRLLGVGRVEVGLRPQTFVDVTIVVGKDFLGEG
ncbi:MAG: LCP family protein [Acidobacteria bacterium]|nr:LCP family protein [Acidobacteriota bacterium]